MSAHAYRWSRRRHYFIVSLLVLCSLLLAFALIGCAGDSVSFNTVTAPQAITGTLSGTDTNSGQTGEVDFSGTNYVFGAHDPFATNAWHLKNTGQTDFAQRGGVAGQDLQLQGTYSAGIFGRGLKVMVSDDGLESAHEDLAANFEASGNKDYTLPSPYISPTAEPKTTSDNHGTCVSGLIGAVAANDKGSQGVAPGVKLHIANFVSQMSQQLEVQKLDQIASGFDLYNQSWGVSQYVLYVPTQAYLDQVQNTVTSGRNGKGSMLCKAAGNDYTVYFTATFRRVGNSNFDGDNSHPYQMVVAALNAKGVATEYSSPGSNLWISAFGGEFGTTDPAVFTTDRQSCSLGYSVSTATQNVFQSGGDGNTNCNYTSTFNGTSSAAPMMTGVVALLMEANPSLTWRQIKHVLAQTATIVNDGATSYSNPYVASPTGHVWEQGWVKNAAGFNFHNRYGFGRVNTDAAVLAAKNPPSFPTLKRTLNPDGTWMHQHSSINAAIPDNSDTGATDSINVTTQMTLEAVQIAFNVQHPNIGEIGVELTSPSGTKSIIVPVNNALEGQANYLGEVMMTNAFYGESSAGNWTIKVLDGRSSNTGTFQSWQILFTGH